MVCIHSGFGLGLERLLIYLTGIENIRDVIPFPRTPNYVNFKKHFRCFFRIKIFILGTIKVREENMKILSILLLAFYLRDV